MDEAKAPFGIPFLQNARGALWVIAQVPEEHAALCGVKRTSINRKPLKTSHSLPFSSAFSDTVPCWPISRVSKIVKTSQDTKVLTWRGKMVNRERNQPFFRSPYANGNCHLYSHQGSNVLEPPRRQFLPHRPWHAWIVESRVFSVYFPFLFSWCPASTNVSGGSFVGKIFWTWKPYALVCDFHRNDQVQFLPLPCKKCHLRAPHSPVPTSLQVEEVHRPGAETTCWMISASALRKFIKCSSTVFGQNFCNWHVTKESTFEKQQPTSKASL